jgi:hypothetical protein
MNWWDLSKSIGELLGYAGLFFGVLETLIVRSSYFLRRDA